MESYVWRAVLRCRTLFLAQGGADIPVCGYMADRNVCPTLLTANFMADRNVCPTFLTATLKPFHKHNHPTERFSDKP
jgi:hypothetical protein